MHCLHLMLLNWLTSLVRCQLLRTRISRLSSSTQRRWVSLLIPHLEMGLCVISDQLSLSIVIVLSWHYWSRPGVKLRVSLLELLLLTMRCIGVSVVINSRIVRIGVWLVRLMCSMWSVWLVRRMALLMDVLHILKLSLLHRLLSWRVLA